MLTFWVNNQEVSGPPERKLIDFLREDLHITSVKNGCEQGTCGTCTILIDGRVRRACMLTLQKLAGKHVTTLEGLSQREKDVFAYAFTQAGAVQCGFCIPGMVMASKGLFLKNLNPNPDEIKKALRGNICRCTGYVKIVQAVLLAAKLLRENLPVPTSLAFGRVGEEINRLDAPPKVLGTGMYTDDMFVEDMLYASAVRSAYPRARVLRINTSLAESHQDCVAVLTAKDVPGNNKIGHIEAISDWDVLISENDITRYVGDAIALVVAKRREALDEIKSLVQVEYEPLTPVLSPQEALKAEAPLLHEKGNILRHVSIQRGDVEQAFQEAAHIVTETFEVPFIEHAFLEPECAIAIPEGDGLLLYSGSQGVYDDQREVARMLGIAPERVRVKGMLVGGAFGGKEDMSVQHHAALAAWLLKKPVKVRFSRDESLRVHPKRHAMTLHYQVACDVHGSLVGLKADIISDTGAYASLGGGVLSRCCVHAGGPYKIDNVSIQGQAVYTNNPPGGAFRGFGVSQSAFAMESCLNLLAEKAGISPWEIRYKNAVRQGDVLPNGQIADKTTGIAECLLAVRDAFNNAPFAGIACSYKSCGSGNGGADTGRAKLAIRDGKVHIYSSAACIGQGIATVLLQIVCETAKLSPDTVVIEPPDTAFAPNTGTTTGSRQTFITGEANRRAALFLRADINHGKTLSMLEGKEYYAEYQPKTEPPGASEHPVLHAAYGYAAQVVTLNHQGYLQKVYSAFDAGTIINPKSAEGQIEGGVVMGLGYALTESFPLESGVPTAKFANLGLLRSTDIPEMETQFIQGEETNGIVYGAKGLGELATVPTAPAVAGAFFARDGIFRTTLPLCKTPYSK